MAPASCTRLDPDVVLRADGAEVAASVARANPGAAPFDVGILGQRPSRRPSSTAPRRRNAQPSPALSGSSGRPAGGRSRSSTSSSTTAGSSRSARSPTVKASPRSIWNSRAARLLVDRAYRREAMVKPTQQSVVARRHAIRCSAGWSRAMHVQPAAARLSATRQRRRSSWRRWSANFAQH